MFKVVTEYRHNIIDGIWENTNRCSDKKANTEQQKV